MKDFERLRDEFEKHVNNACKGVDCGTCRHRFNCGYYFGILLNKEIQDYKDTHKKRKITK